MPVTALPTDLDDVLSGSVDPEQLRQLALNPLQHGMAALLEECLPGGAAAARAELLRTKFKPDRLAATYSLRVLAEPSRCRQVTLTWVTSQLAQRRNLPLLGDAAGATSVPVPYRRLAAATDDGRIVLLVEPADPWLPQLARLSQPTLAAGVLADLSGRPFLGAQLSINTVRYRPGQRHILRLVPGTWELLPAFVKIDRDDSGRSSVPIAQALAPVLTQSCPEAVLASPVGYSRAERAALWTESRGVPLPASLRSVAAPSLVRRAGQALRAMHDGGLAALGRQNPASSEPLRSHDATAEVLATIRAGEHIAVLLSEMWPTYRGLAEGIRERLERLPSEDSTFTHGDFKCDNLLAAQDRICVLDLDRSALADPALDLAKFLADLSWWGQVAHIQTTQLISAFASGYGNCDPARWERARLLAILFALKLAARRIPLHEPAWAHRMAASVSAARNALGLTVAR